MIFSNSKWAVHPNFHLHKVALGAESREVVLYSLPNPVDSTTLDISGLDVKAHPRNGADEDDRLIQRR